MKVYQIDDGAITFVAAENKEKALEILANYLQSDFDLDDIISIQEWTDDLDINISDSINPSEYNYPEGSQFFVTIPSKSFNKLKSGLLSVSDW